MRREDVKVGMLVKTSVYGPTRNEVGLIVQYTGGFWVYVLNNEKIVSWHIGHTDFLEPVKE
jgi:hypothetical protein